MEDERQQFEAWASDNIDRLIAAHLGVDETTQFGKRIAASFLCAAAWNARAALPSGGGARETVTRYSNTGAAAQPDPYITMQTTIPSAPAGLTDSERRALECFEVVERDGGKEVWLLLRADVPNQVGAGSVRLEGAFAEAASRAAKKRDAIITRLTGPTQ